MFKKILIANRGEIACRVTRTARKMGIRAVAVFSEADKDALHVAQADEAVCIGPPPSTESYLDIDRVIRACKGTGAEAIHPGYGFLAENALFAERIAEEGLTFIGPGVDAITSMGDKITSKKLAQEAGVPTIPGSTEVIKDASHAVAVAGEIGYPVMLKATAGGGGKGMRVAHNGAECSDGFERATSEARSSFGDARVFIEKFIEEPRHIEIQVLGDSQGNIIHLGERECSLQRRHQKVIEEAPSPFLDEATRSSMGQQAVALARAVHYRSAGTVEFIVDADRNFFFLEMNTRLQVEHPVTELRTGLDLVEWMIRIAAGEALPWSQSEVPFRGWAIEARIYAEDPSRNFLPSIGRLVRYLPPAESAHVRVDTGVGEGGEVSMHYDPLIAKLITHDATREQAIAHMRCALDQFTIRGVSHNISFLAALVDHARFRDAELSTNLIAQEYPDGFHPADATDDQPARLAAVAAAIHQRYVERAAQISGQLPGHERKIDDGYVVVMGGELRPVEIRSVEAQSVDGVQAIGHEVICDGQCYRVQSDWRLGQPLFTGSINGHPIHLQVERHHLTYRLFHGGSQVDMMVLTPHAAKLLDWLPEKERPDLSKHLLSPMPGLLAQVMVGEGDQIKSGQSLAVVEAMKMENVLLARCDGKVAKVIASVGQTLAVDQLILEFE